MSHVHAMYRFGDTYRCICGATRTDTRTPEQRAIDMEAATMAVKVRVNAAFGVASPIMAAAIAAAPVSPFVRRALARELPSKELGR